MKGLMNMYLCKILTLSTVLLYTLTFPPVEAQIVLPRTPPGKSVQGLRFSNRIRQVIYADTGKKTINIFDFAKLDSHVLQLDKAPTFIIPIKDSEFTFLVGLDRDLVVLYWNYNSTAPLLNQTNQSYFTCLLYTAQSCCHANRWNTGEVDGYGNLWAGTLTILDPPNCDCPPNLYRVSTTQSGLLTPDVAVEAFYSNGIQFTVDYRIMYTIDYYNRQIFSFQFDLIKGMICCPAVVFRYDDYNLTGSPKSMAKDTDGNLWIGSYNGSMVIQINPNTGELLRTVSIPASRVTSVAFSDPRLDTLLVGTEQNDDSFSLLDPLAGSIFAVTGLGVNGVPAAEAAVNSFCKPFYF